MTTLYHPNMCGQIMLMKRVCDRISGQLERMIAHAPALLPETCKAKNNNKHPRQKKKGGWDGSMAHGKLEINIAETLECCLGLGFYYLEPVSADTGSKKYGKNEC